RLDQADDGEPGEGLAGPRFADHAEHLARSDRERDVVHRDEGFPPGGEFDAQVFDFEDQRSFGLSASRSQSPSRLTESTSVTSAAPGNTVIHHSPERRNSLPTRIRVPREGWVGGTPTPRKERVASMRVATAMVMVAMTSTGPMTFGSTCASMMASGRRPITRAA